MIISMPGEDEDEEEEEAGASAASVVTLDTGQETAGRTKRGGEGRLIAYYPKADPVRGPLAVR